MIDLSHFGRPVVTTAELLAAGFSHDAITRAVCTGRLHRLYRGVYAVGRRDLPHPWPWRAALLACGGGALLSHHSAAQHWGIANPHSSLAAAVDVATDTNRKRSHPAINHHRLKLDTRDRRTRQGIALTSPARTLLDLAATMSDGDLEQAVVEADIRKLARADELTAVIARTPTHPGSRALTTIVDRGAWRGLTRSQAERLMLSLVARARLPVPRTNPVCANHRIDFLYERHRLVIEINGFATHGRRKTFDDDHARELDLELAGWHVLRFTANQLRDTPGAVIATLSAALARAEGRAV